MELTQLITLSIIQGITEFLPISSSGHLVILPHLAQWEDQGLLFDMAVHIGTLFAVMVYFKKEVCQLLGGALDTCRGKATVNRKLFLLLVVSTIPLVLVAPFIKDAIELYLRHMWVVGVTSIVFGALLWISDRQEPARGTSEDMRFKDAAVYGLFQVLAMIPGTSRSGITMTAGRFLGFSRVEASRYAMLMSIPVLVLMSGYTVISDMHTGLNWQTHLDILLAGVFLSALCALAAIHFLMTWVQRLGFLPFVVYRIGLGCLLIYLSFM